MKTRQSSLHFQSETACQKLSGQYYNCRMQTLKLKIQTIELNERMYRDLLIELVNLFLKRKGSPLRESDLRSCLSILADDAFDKLGYDVSDAKLITALYTRNKLDAANLSMALDSSRKAKKIIEEIFPPKEAIIINHAEILLEPETETETQLQQFFDKKMAKHKVEISYLVKQRKNVRAFTRKINDDLIESDRKNSYRNNLIISVYETLVQPELLQIEIEDKHTLLIYALADADLLTAENVTACIQSNHVQDIEYILSCVSRICFQLTETHQIKVTQDQLENLLINDAVLLTEFCSQEYQDKFWGNTDVLLAHEQLNFHPELFFSKFFSLDAENVAWRQALIEEMNAGNEKIHSLN